MIPLLVCMAYSRKGISHKELLSTGLQPHVHTAVEQVEKMLRMARSKLYPRVCLRGEANV